MRRKADRVVIAVRLQSLKLANPIDEALTDGCPIAQSWPSAFLTALATPMTNAILRQKIISIGVRLLIMWGYVQVPVSVKCADLTASRTPRLLQPPWLYCTRIRFPGPRLRLSYRPCRPSRNLSLIAAQHGTMVEPPEIKATYAINAKGFRQFGN
jgi:hypothetical protein